MYIGQRRDRRGGERGGRGSESEERKIQDEENERE